MHEKKTSLPNGVIVSVILKNEWNEEYKCKEKIKQQLAYLDNVYYAIQGFDNTYKVYRHQDFQFSPLSQNQMHISLKNIYYPIDWNKLGIKPIHLPLALRFDDYSELKPIFNRESIQYNSATIKAIKDKIQKVADWMVNKWNTEVSEFDNFREAYNDINNSSPELELHGFKFELSQIDDYATINVEPAKVKGVTLKSPRSYIALKDSILWPFEPIAFDSNDKWMKAHLDYEMKRHVIVPYVKGNYYGAKVILVDKTVSGNYKEYLREKYPSKGNKVFYVEKTKKFMLNKALAGDKDEGVYSAFLHLANEPANKHQALIDEFNLVVSHYEASFIDERGSQDSQDFATWLDNHRAMLKAGQKPKTGGVYIPLDKEKGEITYYAGRLDKVSATALTYDKTKKKIEDLPKVKRQVVYAYASDSIPDYMYLAFPNVEFCKINVSEEIHIKNLVQYTKIENFMTSKPMARLASALLIEELFETDLDMELAEITFKDVKDLTRRLRAYKEDKANKPETVNKNTRNVIINHARENNVWDLSIYADIKRYEYILKKFGFMTFIRTTTTNWRVNDVQKKIMQNMMYIMLKHQKINSAMIEEFDLVKKEETPKSSTLVEEATQEEIAMLEEINSLS